jgi:hypothetical protein
VSDSISFWRYGKKRVPSTFRRPAIVSEQVLLRPRAIVPALARSSG